VGWAGLEPAHLPLIRRARHHLATGQLATAELNRAHPAYQAGPIDQVGRGQRMRQESNLQGAKARPGSSRVPSPVGLRIQSGEGRSRTPKALAGSPAFGAGAVTSRLASPWRMAQELNLLRALAPVSGFRPGTLPLGQPSSRGESGIRTHGRRCASRLAGGPRATTPGHLTMSTLPRTRTANARGLSPAALPIGLEGHQQGALCH
jgi:hypothetical protein